jgi:glyoxylase-like metal-dependent hydrolase (beta-lactamase superfamily II)
MPEALPVHVLDTGHCLHAEAVLLRGGAWRVVECHCLVALLHHPREGWVLWDRGYAPRMLAETRRLPYRLYRAATPLRLRADLAVAAQLPRLGLTPRDVRAVIVSHFHADHLCGLRDFPEARFVASRAGFADAARRTGLAALRRGFIPSLLPDDFADRTRLLDDPRDESAGPLGATHDLFGDGTLRLVELPGHARGQLGLLAETTRGPILFAADGAWLARAARDLRPPHPVTNAFVDDPAAVSRTLDRLHEYHRAFPETILAPTHCPEALALLVEGRP